MSRNDKADVLDTCFDFIPLPFGDAPVEFCMALPKTAVIDGGESGLSIPEAALLQAGRIASGRGFTAEQALASCRGELAELIGSCSWDPDKLITASYRDLGESAIHPNSILGFSDQQYTLRDQWNSEHGAYDFVPEKFNQNRPVEWVAVKSLDGGESRFIPAALAFIGYAEQTDPGVFAVGDSNGCAAGSTYEAALQSALLELVERDATGIWWYGQRICPRIDLGSIESGPVKNLVDWCVGRNRSLQLINLTNDLQVPVFAAVSANPDGSHVYMGFGANFDAYQALGAALTEMLQIELSGQTAQLFGQFGSPGEIQTPMQKWHARVSLNNQRHLNSDSARLRVTSDVCNLKASESGKEGISTLMERFDKNRLDAWVLNATIPGLDSDVVRIVVSGFTHYHARFGIPRLEGLSEGLTCPLNYLDKSGPVYSPIMI